MQARIIKSILGYREVTASTLAEKLGKSQSNFAQMLKRDNFRESELLEIADALKCDLKIEFIDRETGKTF